MLGAHLVSTQAPGSEGGITDNEPNALQPRNPFHQHERSLSSVHTAPASAESLVISAEPKTLETAAASYGGGAVQRSKGRLAQRAVEGKMFFTFHQANFYFIAAAFLALTGMMQGARGARLARIPDPPSWNPDSANAMPYRTWTQRLMVWGILAADLDPSQQCVAIVCQLHGSARELADAPR